MSPHTPHSVQARNPWRTAIVAGIASYLDAGAITTLGTAVVLFAPSMGLTDTDVGIISALLTLCFALGAVFGGRLGDMFGRKRVFTITLIVYVVGAAMMVGSLAPAMLYLAAILLGLAIGADLPVSLALIAEEAPEGQKGRMIAFSGFLWMVGAFVPSFLTAAVASLGELGGRILFAQLLVVAFVVLVLRLGLRESAEWSATRRLSTAELLDGSDHNEVRFSHLKQLFRRPVVLTVVALGLYYGLWNLAGNTLGQFSSFIWVNVAGLDLAVQSLRVQRRDVGGADAGLRHERRVLGRVDLQGLESGTRPDSAAEHIARHHPGLRPAPRRRLRGDHPGLRHGRSPADVRGAGGMRDHLGPDRPAHRSAADEGRGTRARNFHGHDRRRDLSGARNKPDETTRSQNV